MNFSPDLANALFEILGGAFLAPSVHKAFTGKIVQGVHPLTPAFFWFWGLWNMFYYPVIGQPISGVAGVVVFVVNSAWFYCVLKYGRKAG